ncbi:queuosine precursor transporter [Patescibacteria group bacterium]|nr:queuosine precursor transporter [Patescibacteria group bacterium]
MKKEEIRKEFFKLRIKHHSYNQCRKILKAKFNFKITKRTLQRWNKRHNETEWDFKDKSSRPKNIKTKITQDDELKIIKIKKKTGSKHLWLRNNGSTWASQAIDSVVFTLIAFWGVFPDIWQIILFTYIIKIIVAAIDTPFIYLSKKLLPKELKK